MKKTFKDTMNKTMKELEKEVITLRGEIMKNSMEARSNPQKDTNLVSKRKKRLAVLLTAMNQQREAEAFKNTK